MIGCHLFKWKIFYFEPWIYPHPVTVNRRIITFTCLGEVATLQLTLAIPGPGPQKRMCLSVRFCDLEWGLRLWSNPSARSVIVRRHAERQGQRGKGGWAARSAHRFQGATQLFSVHDAQHLWCLPHGDTSGHVAKLSNQKLGKQGIGALFRTFSINYKIWLD